MSESVTSNDSGFRSRQRDMKRRQEARRIIMENFQTKKNEGNLQFENPQNSTAKNEQTRKYLKIQELAELHKNHEYQDQKNQSQDDIDMFADESQVEKNKSQKDQKATKKTFSEQTDDQGYYSVIEGSIIGNGKYKVLQKLGKGMFGSVIKGCLTDNQTQKFAIKIIRKNEMMKQSGQKEYQLLSSIKKADYIMKMHDYFFQQGHLCLVCELMGEDLRSYVRKHQSAVTLDEIKKYAISMFMSLHELRKNKIIHADIKPDNFLFSNDQKKVKLCDFGTSYKVDEHSSEIQYLVARYYRAPQIMLGYDTSPENRYHIDTWAVACSLFEVYTGEFLFNGSTNNEMLKQMMETKDKHFDSEFNFLYETYDKSTKKNTIKKMQFSITAERELLQRLRKYGRSGQQGKKVHNFRDFLEKCLALNPKDRLTPEEAFLHPFLNYQIKLC